MTATNKVGLVLVVLRTRNTSKVRVTQRTKQFLRFGHNTSFPRASLLGSFDFIECTLPSNHYVTQPSEFFFIRRQERFRGIDSQCWATEFMLFPVFPLTAFALWKRYTLEWWMSTGEVEKPTAQPHVHNNVGICRRHNDESRLPLRLRPREGSQHTRTHLSTGEEQQFRSRPS